MNKKVNEVKSIIKNYEDQKREAVAKIKAELTATEKKLEELRKVLPTVENADQYKTIIREIRDNEEVLTYFGKKKAEAEQKTISQKDYMAIVKDVQIAFEAVKAERSKVIFAEIEKLIKELDTYDDEVAEMNDLLSRANSLARVTTPRAINARALTTPSDPDDQYHFFIDGYYKMRQVRIYQSIHGGSMV